MKSLQACHALLCNCNDARCGVGTMMAAAAEVGQLGTSLANWNAETDFAATIGDGCDAMAATRCDDAESDMKDSCCCCCKGCALGWRSGCADSCSISSASLGDMNVGPMSVEEGCGAGGTAMLAAADTCAVDAPERGSNVCAPPVPPLLRSCIRLGVPADAVADAPTLSSLPFASVWCACMANRTSLLLMSVWVRVRKEGERKVQPAGGRRDTPAPEREGREGNTGRQRTNALVSEALFQYSCVEYTCPRTV